MSQNESSITKPRDKTKIPKDFAVVIHNDDITPMDFVVQILVGLFNKNPREANEICMKVHHEGRGIAGTYFYEVAATKVSLAKSVVQEYGYPLKFTVEEK